MSALISSSTLKKIGAELLPPAALWIPSAVVRVGHAAVEAAGEIRRRVWPARFAVLVIADDVQARCAQRVGVFAGQGLGLEVGARVGTRTRSSPPRHSRRT